MPYLPSLTALRCLDASARSRSFTRAAEELHLTQSAVSHHILNLEQQLGVKLFERDKGRLELTQAGKIYWMETLPAVEQLQRATTHMIALTRDPHTLTVSVPPSFANSWLMPRVCDFVANNRDITLNLINRLGAPGTHADEEDATIELSEGNAPGTVSIRLLSLVYKLYASPALLRRLNFEHLLGRGDFSNDALVQLLHSSDLIRTSMTDAWEGWLRQAALDQSVDPSHWADGPTYTQASLAMIAVINGMGVALLPKHVVDAHHQPGAVVRLSEIGWRPRRAYHLEWSAIRPVTAQLRRFADWAVTVAESEAS